jgi:hypothetical protein
VVSIYLTETDECSPCFQTCQQAKTLVNEVGKLSIPVEEKGVLMFTVQIESKASVKKAPSLELSRQPSKDRSKFDQHLKVAMRSRASSVASSRSGRSA